MCADCHCFSRLRTYLSFDLVTICTSLMLILNDEQNCLCKVHLVIRKVCIY